MSEPTPAPGRTRSAVADVVAARTTGVGAGLAAFMVVWALADRIAGLFWAPPAGPVVAMSLAVVAGVVVSWVVGARLVASLEHRG